MIGNPKPIEEKYHANSNFGSVSSLFMNIIDDISLTKYNFRDKGNPSVLVNKKATKDSISFLKQVTSVNGNILEFQETKCPYSNL